MAPPSDAGPSQVADRNRRRRLATALFGLIVIIGSLQVGVGWGADGPRSGFFPFYLGLAIVIASAVNLVQSFGIDRRRLFADWSQLRQVVAVVIPTAVYVAVVPWIGLYVASILLIAGFMVWLGGYHLLLCRHGRHRTVALTYLTFEWWFLVPLPKGPLEDLASGLAESEGPMEDIGNLFHGFAVVLQPQNIGLMIVGILLGVIIGVLPGLGGANGVAILLPLTFSMSPTSAIIMLSCIYWGALFGGAITSVLFNIPGEPWSVATTFDGHPMAQQGRAGEALTAAFTSSFVGALFAVIMITLLAPLVAKFALQFGPAEKFAVFFLAFCSFIGMGKEPAFKTIVAMMIGFALAAVGLDSITGNLRLTFGFTELLERLRLPDRRDRPVRHRRDPADHGGRPGVQGPRRGDEPEGGVAYVERTAALLAYLAASCLIGCWMGISPAGATPASFMSYGIAKRSSRNGGLFRHRTRSRALLRPRPPRTPPAPRRCCRCCRWACPARPPRRCCWAGC